MVYPWLWERVPVEILAVLSQVHTLLLASPINPFVNHPPNATIKLFKTVHVATDPKVIVMPDKFCTNDL